LRRPVLIGWSLSSFTGWGVYGVNLALAWAADPDLQPVAARPIFGSEIALDPLRRLAFGGVAAESQRFQTRLAEQTGDDVGVNATLLASLNDSFVRSRVPGLPLVRGRPEIAVTFFETAQLTPEAVAHAKAYPVIVAGSTWNAELLRAHGLKNVQTILQGVDTSLFHPAPRNGWLGDRFLVFSGGKLERRKGQDIVLAAFRIFAARHPEALLAAAWHSPWPAMAASVDASGLCAPVAFQSDGAVDVAGWAEASGVPRHQVLDLGRPANADMPRLLCEMDLAVFPNRAEGGTNLVAMEAMACGVPTALSANTGHLDLTQDGVCYPLSDQGAVEGQGGFGDVGGWGETRPEELAEVMERAFNDRAEARRIGAAGAAKLAAMTWGETAAKMKALVLATPAA